MVKRRRIAEVIQGEPLVRIGKSGLHDGLIHEILRKLEEEGVVKVRVLRSYLVSSGTSTRSIAETVSKLTDSRVVTVRGHTFVIQKRAKGGRPKK